MEAFDPSDVTAIVNVGDDVTLHGLRVCPDLDTCTYTLAEAIDPERGWGLVDESFKAMAALGRYGGLDWFSLGDQDLGTHLYRTQRLTEGAHPDRSDRRNMRSLGSHSNARARQQRPGRGPESHSRPAKRSVSRSISSVWPTAWKSPLCVSSARSRRNPQLRLSGRSSRRRRW